MSTDVKTLQMTHEDVIRVVISIPSVIVDQVCSIKLLSARAHNLESELIEGLNRAVQQEGKRLNRGSFCKAAATGAQQQRINNQKILEGRLMTSGLLTVLIRSLCKCSWDWVPN
eukprot:1015018-Amphidinium_carterae.1